MAVIPGHREAMSPDSIEPHVMPQDGFRARAARAPE
jgi:hypothetical protein